MNKKYLYFALGLSVVINIIFLFVFLHGNSSSKSESKTTEYKESSPFADYNTRQKAAENAVRKYVCENLYYPNSYDPVSTRVDSVFYNYLTDADCLKAAIELIDLRSSYESAKNSYDENVNNIKTFGGSGVFRHFTVDRDAAAKNMKELLPKIEKRESIIKNRDTSKDGEFIGWQVIHRYRASDSNGVVSFGDVLFIFDPLMYQYYFRFSLEDNDNKNLKAIKTVIEKELGIYVDD